MGAPEKIAEKVVSQVEKRAYDGIPTKKVMKMILSYLRKYRPEFKNITDLREAICVLRPKPDFEIFIARLLEAHGFKVKSNQMVHGECVEHEIDAIAKRTIKDKHGHTINEVFYVEVKHHYKPHTYTGLGVFLEAQATFEDLVDGHKAGKNKHPFTGAIVVSNTKLSNHAQDYSICRKMMGLAWKTPLEHGLERMIEEKKLYPITFIRGLSADYQARLGDNRIVTIKQMLETDDDELHRLTRIPKKKIRELKQKASVIMKAKKE
jgi:hypothetical protein